MSEDCIFCSIVDGDIPARVVYENDGALAFFDANPLAPGHTLVIPKEHYGTLAETPAEPAEMAFAIVHYLTPRIEDAVDADASTVAVNNGEAAGQEVPHLHLHIVPRFDDDGGKPIHALAGEAPDLSEAALDDLAAEIRAE